MANAKKKSSGWRPDGKRLTLEERQARQDATLSVKTRRYCTWLRLWRDCSSRQCRRARGCAGDATLCLKQHDAKSAAQGKGVARATAPARPATATGTEAPRFAMSAKEAAAAIAASIAKYKEEPGYMPDDDLEPVVRDGRV